MGSLLEIMRSVLLHARSKCVGLQQVPVDGVTVRGAAHVSSQHITGEAQPILAEEGTELLAGSLSTDSWLILRATKVARESALARIAELTEFAKVLCCMYPCLPA